MKYTNAVIITGPTTTGKTEIAIELARKLDGEIINSDRLYVYSFLKIGSGLSDCLKSTDITRHLYEICAPNEILTTEEYVKLVEETVPKILNKNKLPIIEGCSSVYNPALLDANKKTRRIFYYTPAIAIIPPKETDLQSKIEKRLNQMLNDGLLEEAKIVFNNGLKNSHPVKISAVYNPLMKYFENKKSLEQTKKEIIQRGITFAQTQQKQFENLDEIILIEHDKNKPAKTINKIIKLIKNSQTKF